MMVYINAKNDLESYGLEDLNEMELAGSSAKVNVVVEFGRMATYDQGDGGWHGVRRYLVKRDADASVIKSPVLEAFQSDMGDWRHLAEFGRWAKNRFPARRYLLVVWNHGTGWKNKGVSYDEYSGNHITTPQLASALAEMGGVDVLAFDACLMQMAEVVYEVKDLAGYVVASEETEPGSGYPYDVFLKELLGAAKMAPARLAAVLADAFGAYYGPDSAMSATQSAVNAASMGRLAELTGDWVSLVMRYGDRSSVLAALGDAQSFAEADNKDLAHFLRLAGKRSGDPRISVVSAELAGFIERELVLSNMVSGGGPPGARGLAVYLPARGLQAGYGAMRWARDSKWEEFINWYLQ
jgi:hypothetical protein